MNSGFTVIDPFFLPRINVKRKKSHTKNKFLRNRSAAVCLLFTRSQRGLSMDQRRLGALSHLLLLRLFEKWNPKLYIILRNKAEFFLGVMKTGILSFQKVNCGSISLKFYQTKSKQITLTTKNYF